MTEKMQRHEYKPAKMNPFRCDKCPFLRGNQIHTDNGPQGMTIRGTAHPNKLG